MRSTPKQNIMEYYLVFGAKKPNKILCYYFVFLL